MSPRRPSLALVGTGRVGAALGGALCEAGWTVARVACLGRARARSLARRLGSGTVATSSVVEAVADLPLVLLAVPGAALPELASELAAGARPWRGRTVLHTSGDAPDTALAPLRRAGASVGRLHPLFPFTGHLDEARRLRGCWFGVSGGRRAQALAGSIAGSLGGRVLKLPRGAEGSYHLSAVAASNLMVALAAVAAGLGAGSGRSRKGMLAALLPLMQGTLENLEARGLPAALTGPLARGETDAIRAHLDLLRGDPEISAAYRALSLVAVRLAREAVSITPGTAAELRRLLSPGAPRTAARPGKKTRRKPLRPV